MLHLLHLDGHAHVIDASRVEVDWRHAGHPPCNSPLATDADESLQMLMSFEDGSSLYLQVASEPGSVGYRLKSPHPYRWQLTQQEGVAHLGWKAC